MKFLRKKDFHAVKEAGKTGGLNKTLGALDLVLIGLGAIVGTGVFTLTGLVAAEHAGPAVTVSYTIAGLICIFVALAYTEVAAMLPTSGSIYTYCYVAFGEIFAWLIGSVIVVQLGFASGAVASSWSTYFQGMLAAGGIKLPAAIATVENGIMNLPAIMISLFIGFVLYLGTRDSKILNAVLVFTKMAAIFIFILTAAPHFDATNWKNFTPNGTAGVLAGASILFFAFNGFNTIAAAAEECKNPKRDITIGIIGSLVLSTAVYVVVAGLLTGMAPLEMLNNAESLAVALRYNNSSVGSAIVAIGAVCGMATVLMMNIYGQSRIFYVISRDGLLPKSMAKLHPKHDSPYVTLLIFTSLAAILGGFFPTLLLGELSSMGSLIDFAAVSLIVMIFRLRFPDAERPFKCPILFIIAPTAIICTCYLLILQVYRDGEFLKTGKIMLVWFAIMAVLYIIRVTIFKREDDFSITEE
ncbi:MAG: amino acid permease [Rickettsiaceae bacterium]|nr:amino acid permease [Rickettsiaceae bacterium]